MDKYTKRFNILLALLMGLNLSPAYALGKHEISMDALEQGRQVEISPGYGLTINLFNAGTINRVWLTDKSWLTLANENGACPNGGCGQSKFVELHLISKLDFDGLPSTVDGKTLLKAVTSTGKILQFQIVRDRDGIPNYTTVYVQPEAPKPIAKIAPQPVAVVPRPIPRPVQEIPIEILLPEEEEKPTKVSPQEPEPVVATVELQSVVEEKDSDQRESLVLDVKAIQIEEQKKPIRLETSLVPLTSEAKKTETTIQEETEVDSIEDKPITILPLKEKPQVLTNHDYANAIGRGLIQGRINGQVGYQSRAYRKAQSAIRHLRRGASLKQAISRSGSQESVIEQLIKWGSR